MARVQRIVPAGKECGVIQNEKAQWLEARRITKDKGGLPSNVLWDKYMVEGNRWREVRYLFPACAREVFVYPEKGGWFQKGKDVVDTKVEPFGHGNKGAWVNRAWVLTASDVPEEAIGRKKVGLFIDPEHITEEVRRIVIHPKILLFLVLLFKSLVAKEG